MRIMVRRRAWVSSVVVGLFVSVLGAVGAGCLVAPAAPDLTNGYEEKDHEQYFPIGAGASHELGKIADGGPIDDPISCSGCHNGGDSFKEFFCLNCHGQVEGELEAKHELIDAFVRENPSCLGCHLDGRPGTQIAPPPSDAGPGHDAGPVFDHNVAAFPYAIGTPHSPEYGSAYMLRANAQGRSHCFACHVQGNPRTDTRCAECHAEDTGPTVTEVHTPDPMPASFAAVPDCKQCHQPTPLADMLRLDNHDAVSCGGAHPDVDSCFDCHDQTRLQGQPKEWAFDFTLPPAPLTCIACHDDAREYPDPCP